MEKYVNWFILSLKLHMKKPGTWIFLITMIFVIPLLWQIRMPDGTNTTVSVCCNGSAYENDILLYLQKGTDSLFFISEKNPEDVIFAVESGRSECGFVLSEDFDKGIENGDWDEIVTCYVTPFSTKAEIAKEAFFAAIYPLYSEWLLTTTRSEIYGTEDEAIKNELLAANEARLNGQAFLTIDKIYMDAPQNAGKSQTYPIQGFVALFLFFAAFLASGIRFETDIFSIHNALPKRKKAPFTVLYILGATLPIALTGWILILLSGSSRGTGKELLLMLFLWMAGSLCGLLFGKLFRKESTFYSLQLAILLFHVIFCPILWNITDYAPALGFVSYLSPVGIYLLL